MKDFPIDDRNEIGKKKQKVPNAMMSKFVEQQIREMVRKEMKGITEDGTLDRGEKALPSKIKLYMKRFSDELNKANLNKIKKVAVLYKIIQSLGLNPQELVMYIQKIKKGMKDDVKEGKLQEDLGWALDWESEIAQLINSKELKMSLKSPNKKIKSIAQRLRKNLIQVHIGFDGLKDEVRRVYGEGKLQEDLIDGWKNDPWEVYVRDEKGKEKIVKVAKSKRAAVILYNKLAKTDKYHEVGMRVIGYE